MKPEFWVLRNISKVIRNLRSHFKKVPWKVPTYGAFKMMNCLSCDNFLLCVLRVTQPMHCNGPAFLHNFRSLKEANFFLLKCTDEEIDFATINIIRKKVRRED